MENFLKKFLQDLGVTNVESVLEEILLVNSDFYEYGFVTTSPRCSVVRFTNKLHENVDYWRWSHINEMLLETFFDV